MFPMYSIPILKYKINMPKISLLLTLITIIIIKLPLKYKKKRQIIMIIVIVIIKPTFKTNYCNKFKRELKYLINSQILSNLKSCMKNLYKIVNFHRFLCLQRK